MFLWFTLRRNEAAFYSSTHYEPTTNLGQACKVRELSQHLLLFGYET
jgi:hypothetical protein